MRYPCLVLDHDDTVTESTAYVHHPAFLAILKELRPGMSVTLEEYFKINFDPGFLEYCEDVLNFTPREMAREYEMWQQWVAERVPRVYPGMARIIQRQIADGGHVCVVSHSVDANIRRDYKAAGLPEPELVFGWELPRGRRKPSPWPLEQIMERLGLDRKELLVLDDLKPGYDMAAAAGVDFAASQWAHHVPEIRTFMAAHAEHRFETPEELEAWLFDD